MNLPRSKRKDVLTTKLEDEVVIYDPETKQAHSLNRVAVAVWNHSDEASSLDDLHRIVATEVGRPVERLAITSALRKLEAAHLLLNRVHAIGPMTRREVLVKGGKLGAVAAVTPLIASALVPTAAAAASPQFTCTTEVGGCGLSPTCGPGCFCFESDAPGPFCFNDFFCGPAVPCNASGDCPAGLHCTTNTCCPTVPGFAGFCAPACNGTGVPLGPATGKTAAGRTV